MTSPTPYWSSSIMNMPDRKSLTMFCAPKPRATPTIDVPAMNGARSMRSSLSTSRNAITKMMADTADFSTDPSVAARWRRRSDSQAGRLEERAALEPLLERSQDARHARRRWPAGRARSIIRSQHGPHDQGHDDDDDDADRLLDQHACCGRAGTSAEAAVVAIEVDIGPHDATAAATPGKLASWRFQVIKPRPPRAPRSRARPHILVRHNGPNVAPADPSRRVPALGHHPAQRDPALPPRDRGLARDAVPAARLPQAAHVR